MFIEDVVRRFITWATTRDDVRGLALVGSYARGNPHPDSDIDLILLSDRPNLYVDDAKWLAGAPYCDRIYIRSWGRVTEHRLQIEGGREVELGITDPGWATDRPVDDGTAGVVRAGFRPLYDPDGLLAALAAEVVAERPNMDELVTDRLLLRRWRPEDVTVLAEIYSDPEVVRYLTPRSRDDTEQQVLAFDLQWREQGFGMWAVEELSSGLLIGRIGLFRHDDWTAGPDPVEVGWTLQRSRWGQGLATEGGRAAIDYGFDSVGLRRIISITHPDNSASQRVMTKLGLALQGDTTWHGHGVMWYAIDRRDKAEPD